MSFIEDSIIQNKYLDQIDFTRYFKDCETVEEIRDRLEFDYDDSSFCDNEELQGCILNYYSTYDLMRYLEHRYNITCKTIYTESYLLPREAKYVKGNEHRI